MKSITSESPCSFFSSAEAAAEGAASENNLNNGELKGRATLEHFTRFEKPRTLYIADYLSREERLELIGGIFGVPPNLLSNDVAPLRFSCFTTSTASAQV